MEKIIFQGNFYDKVRRFDCNVVDLGYNEGGSFFTVIPISPVEYRRANPTKAHVEITEPAAVPNHILFSIWDDWGSCHEIYLPRKMSAEIEAAKKSAIEMELLKLQ